MELKPGMPVQLVTDERMMTVESIDGDDVVCVWRDPKGMPQKGIYKAVTLKEYKGRGLVATGVRSPRKR